VFDNVRTEHVVGLFIALAALAVLIEKLLGIATKVRDLRTRNRDAEPVDAAQFDKHVQWATGQNHDRRNEANAITLKLAVIEQSVSAGLTRRVEVLEERTEVMAGKVDRCAFILEQEFGGKHRRTSS
jgi:hypothetical protein